MPEAVTWEYKRGKRTKLSGAENCGLQ